MTFGFRGIIGAGTISGTDAISGAGTILGADAILGAGTVLGIGAGMVAIPGSAIIPVAIFLFISTVSFPWGLGSIAGLFVCDCL